MAFEEFKLCIKPNPNLAIWRYINLEKFESMLKEKALFFCRVDRFSDPYEGSIPKKIAEYRIEPFKSISEKSNLIPNQQKAQERIKILSNAHRQIRKNHIVNCWHINNTENDSMWRLYLKSNGGVAIKTTVRRLLNSLSTTNEKIFCSKVRYIDYENSTWYDETEYPFKSYNLFIPLIHKRIEFKQEEEIRLITEIETNIGFDKYWELQPNQKGKNICVDLENLIEIVYSSPTSDGWQIDKIRKIITKYNYDFEVQKSALSINPYY